MANLTSFRTDCKAQERNSTVLIFTGLCLYYISESQLHWLLKHVGKYLVLFKKLQACWESVYSKSPDLIRKVVEFLRAF